MTSRTHVLLWTDSAAAYLDAIKAAGHPFWTTEGIIVLPQIRMSN